MSRVLYIKANPKTNEESRTFKISESFISEYKKLHPDDEIITIDLYAEKIDFLISDMAKMHGSALQNREHPVLKYAYQFLEADKYVIAEPFWNLSIPAILKAYIDYITFEYTEEGPKGLCRNKKAVNITARGGFYSQGPASSYEMGDRYLRTILGFLGITDFKTIAAEKLDIYGENVEEIISQAVNEAKSAAAQF